MKKDILFAIPLFLAFNLCISAQDFSINNTRVEYDGNKLSISYNLSSRKKSDKFFVLPRIIKNDGTPVRARSFSGDVGANISPGNKLSISWVPEDDAVFLNDTVSVELNAEKYEMSFKRGGVVMSSLFLPGLGQTKITNGSPWWLAGIAAYGTLGGGFVFNSKYKESYNAYLIETDPVERSDLFNQSQDDKQLSRILFISAGALWAGNMIWAAAAPNEYRELKLPELSVYASPAYGSRGIIAMLSLTYDF
ncbi:MAG: hypothetical protein V2I37_11485 [Marinilabiliaceae bacterium]|jgi:hypothetical protein|nr:hypothetical protein [Marinilabiliaceae bacterium]